MEPFLCYWPFVRGIHRSPVNFPHRGLWRGALMFSLICAWINGWVNSGKAGDLRRHRAHYDVTVMKYVVGWNINTLTWMGRCETSHTHESYRLPWSCQMIISVVSVSMSFTLPRQVDMIQLLSPFPTWPSILDHITTQGTEAHGFHTSWLPYLYI